ncbi:F0F1 ATP synthase subunit B family protein [Plastoroseomonas arctica]|uniref:ATP synthase subunit b n=1 Tax=Plastoroseomonas arctica TaxID=1509237 RepID=A0AAF1JZ26_9PROT|nr:F0F1 ATP synthase subunit B' [Plastoroseomonas arctica]MBR0657424.1 F0F1 ATP synthase subunit B' [Plastoroseomonas arctica]
MPQLDFANPLMIGQIVWLLIIFGALYYILSTYALPKVATVLEDRAARIAADLNLARAAKAEADTAMVALRDASAKARAESQGAIAAAAAKATAEAQARAEELNAKLSARIAESEAQIGRARDTAMGALREVASETTLGLLQKLTGRADDAAVGRAVDAALAARTGG